MNLQGCALTNICHNKTLANNTRSTVEFFLSVLTVSALSFKISNKYFLVISFCTIDAFQQLITLACYEQFESCVNITI